MFLGLLFKGNLDCNFLLILRSLLFKVWILGLNLIFFMKLGSWIIGFGLLLVYCDFFFFLVLFVVVLLEDGGGFYLFCFFWWLVVFFLLLDWFLLVVVLFWVFGSDVLGFLFCGVVCWWCELFRVWWFWFCGDELRGWEGRGGGIWLFCEVRVWIWFLLLLLLFWL